MNFNLVLYFTHFQITPQKCFLIKNISGRNLQPSPNRQSRFVDPRTHKDTHKTQTRGPEIRVSLLLLDVQGRPGGPVHCSCPIGTCDLQVTPQAVWVWASYWSGSSSDSLSNFFQITSLARGSPGLQELLGTYSQKAIWAGSQTLGHGLLGTRPYNRR